MPPRLQRGFVDIAEGQVHVRRVRARQDLGRPLLLLLHSSALSSLLLARFAQELAATRDVLAVDTLGQGDSCPPRGGDVDMGYFADATARVLAALGIAEPIDVFGTHSGARIASELAIRHPGCVRKLVLDGMRRMPAVIADDYLALVDMSRHVDADGGQFHKAWSKWRDEYLFRPPYRWVADQMTGSPLPSPHDMHEAAIEVFKGIVHGHIAYQAAIRYRVDERLPLITQPTLATCGERDGAFSDLAFVANLVPGSTIRPHPEKDRVEHATPGGLAALAAMVAGWLDEPVGTPARPAAA